MQFIKWKNTKKSKLDSELHMYTTSLEVLNIYISFLISFWQKETTTKSFNACKGKMKECKQNDVDLGGRNYSHRKYAMPYLDT